MDVNMSSLNDPQASYTAKNICQIAASHGARPFTMGKTLSADDIDELPPPQDAPAGMSDEACVNYLWDFVQKHEQHFRDLKKAPAVRKTGQPIYVDRRTELALLASGERASLHNESPWTPEEDQILFDNLLLGDVWYASETLSKRFQRTLQQTEDRIKSFVPERVPEFWYLPREETYLAVRKRMHDGETSLTQAEYKELIVWLINDYKGINPSVFEWSRSTERLRQEARIFDDIDISVLDRVGTIFLAEKASTPQQTKVKVFGARGPEKPEVKARRKERDATRKEETRTRKAAQGKKGTGAKGQSQDAQNSKDNDDATVNKQEA